MYLGSRHPHPSVLAILEQQGVSKAAAKPTAKPITEAVKRPIVEAVEKDGQIIFEGVSENGESVRFIMEDDGFFDEIMVPVGNDQAFFLSEDETTYELIQIDEGIGSLFRKAMGGLRWMWGNIKDKLKGKLPDATIRGLAKLYRDDPKTALAELRKQYAAQGLKGKALDRQINATKNSLDHVVAARTSLSQAVRDARSNDPQRQQQGQHLLGVHANAGAQIMAAQQQAKQSGEDPNKAALAALRSSDLHQIVVGGGQPVNITQQQTPDPAKAGAQKGQQQGQGAQQGQQPAQGTQQPAQQGQGAQQPAQQPVTHMGFKEGDDGHRVDSKTGQTVEGKAVKPDQQMLDAMQKGLLPQAPLVMDVNGQKEAITNVWKPGKAPAPGAQPPAAGQPPPAAPGAKPAAQPPAAPGAQPPAAGPGGKPKRAPRVASNAQMNVTMSFIKPDGSKDRFQTQMRMANVTKMLATVGETGVYNIKGVGQVTVTAVHADNGAGIVIDVKNKGKNAGKPAAQPAGKPTKPPGSATVAPGTAPAGPATAALPGAKQVTMAPAAGGTP